MSEGHIQEVRLCSVHEREVIGVTEIVLGLESFVNSLRCTRDCEIYTVGLKPFRSFENNYILCLLLFLIKWTQFGLVLKGKGMETMK